MYVPSRSVISVIAASSHPDYNNRMFLSWAYGLIVCPGKFDAFKTNISPTEKQSLEGLHVVLRTSNFQEKTIRPIGPRQFETHRRPLQCVRGNVGR